MRIVEVSPIGFCSGVKRAIGIVKEALKKKGDYYSLGPIIHNQYITEELSKKGLKPLPFYQEGILQNKRVRAKLINDLFCLFQRCPSKNKNFRPILFLPTHGTSLKIIKRLKRKNIDFIDLICPYVSSVHRICRDLKRKGLQIIIFGDKFHSEVKALKEIVSDAIVIDPGLVYKAGVDRKTDLLDNLLQGAKKLAFISQTTQSKDKYLQLVSNLIKKYSQIKEFYIFNTICPECIKRQEEVKRISKRVDLMIVIGGKDSANTKRLYQIAKRIRKNSYHIEDQKDLERLPILSMSRKRQNMVIGISSGASTPEVLVRKIIRSLRR